MKITSTTANNKMISAVLHLVPSFHLLVLLHLLCFQSTFTTAFSILPRSVSSTAFTTTAAWRLFDRNRWEQEIEENSRFKARNKNSAAGGTVTGAILGGLLAGPFGALFGANIGANFGSQRALDKARQEEMERLGITADMLQAAKDVGIALEESIQGLKATQDALQTQQSYARRLDREVNELYEQAMSALQQNQDEKARQLLFERIEAQEKLKKALKDCADERKRLERMEDNVAKIEKRAKEIESLLSRSVGAKTLQNSEEFGLSLSTEDPLLKKFRDLGID